jgi:hypothetical protein
VVRTFAACALAAAVALAALAVAGRPRAGVALAAGLLIGSTNSWLARRSLGMELSFRVASLGRLAALTIVGLGVGLLLGVRNAPLTVVGLGVAQLLLASLAARTALETTGA